MLNKHHLHYYTKQVYYYDVSTLYFYWLDKQDSSCLNFQDEAWWFFIIKGLRTIVFIFIVISTMFWTICPPAFFRCLLNSGTITELRTMSFIESTCIQLWLMKSEQATSMDSIKDIVQSSMKVPEFDKHLKKAGGRIGQNVVELTMKMKTMVQKPSMIKSKILFYISYNLI